MLRDLQSLYSLGTLVGLTDRSLIEAFRSANREGDTPRAEAALSAVIDRHAGMVWNLCRSVIRDTHDAEDAFQATFLILVRKAGSLRVGETLGPWLHVVAYRTALGVRASVASGRASTFRGVVVPCRDDRRSRTGSTGRSGRSFVRRSTPKSAGLPEAFRAVVVLCDLEGLAYLEAARRLNVPLGTVQSRLARARRRLRRSLTLKGIHPSDGSEACDPSGDQGWMDVWPADAADVVGRVGRLGAGVAADPTESGNDGGGSVQALIERTRSMGSRLVQAGITRDDGRRAGRRGPPVPLTPAPVEAGVGCHFDPAGRAAQDRDEIKRPDEIPSLGEVRCVSRAGKDRAVPAVDGRRESGLRARGRPMGPWNRRA